MKKMIFTAAAVLAFSGIALANTKEDKKDTKEVKKTAVVKEEDKERTPCDAGWIQAYELAVQYGGFEAGSNGAYWVADSWAKNHNC
jgi:hypothetical protein